ncbi:hypothetical protein DSO57_1029312 [Entomophthora muscae]|uniref:Uncharacterized protein n=1 Tax=Entomophthora muscae TaxID=34485 RepID=A0ACC2RSC5_9FUNG|nr:hypothetical protein DSO57_1029312 [Entomophthora muscae]
MMTYNFNNPCEERAETIKKYLVEDGSKVIGLQEINKFCKGWETPSGWQRKVSTYCALVLTDPKLQFVESENLYSGHFIKARICYEEKFTFTACAYTP